MKIQSELGLRIRYYRKQQGFSQEKFAEICSLHPTYIGQIERGEKNATIESLLHIAKGLNVPLSQLLAHLEDIPDETEQVLSVPMNIYNKVIMLTPEKQEQISCILDAILDFSGVQA